MFRTTTTQHVISRPLARSCLVALLIMLLVASACSAPFSAAPEPVMIVITASKIGKDAELLQKQLDEFTRRNPDIKVLTRVLPDSHTDRYHLSRTYLQNRDPSVDVYMVDVTWPAEFAANGWLIPLDGRVKQHQIDTSDFFESVIANNTVDDKLVAIPWIAGGSMLFYRKDLLDQYGYAVPKTWEELQKTALAIKERAGLKYGYIWQGVSQEELTCNALEYVWSHGGDVVNNQGDVIFKSDATIAAYQTMQQMITSGASPASITGHKLEDTRNVFQQGDAVFARNMPYTWSLYNDPLSPVAGKVGAALMPAGSSGQPAACLNGFSLAVSAFSAHPDEAFKLVAFLTSAEQQVFMALNSTRGPTRKSVYQSEDLLKAKPFMKKVLEVFSATRFRPRSAAYAQISEAIFSETNGFLMNPTDPAATVQAIDEKLHILQGR